MNDHGQGIDAPRGREPADHPVTALPILCGTPVLSGASAPRGLALDFVEGEFIVQLWPADGAGPLRLGPYDYEDVVAVWRRMASTSGLPLLLPGPDGQLQQPYPQIGRLMVGARSERRRLAVLSGRRPRFLAKRRATALPRRPRIHREAELAGGQAR